MSRNIDVRVKCPFFVEEPACNKKNAHTQGGHSMIVKKRIRCEGLMPGSKVYQDFKSAAEKDRYFYDFCSSECWRGCPIAAMLLELYGVKKEKG